MDKAHLLKCVKLNQDLRRKKKSYNWDVYYYFLSLSREKRWVTISSLSQTIPGDDNIHNSMVQQVSSKIFFFILEVCLLQDGVILDE